MFMAAISNTTSFGGVKLCSDLDHKPAPASRFTWIPLIAVVFHQTTPCTALFPALTCRARGGINAVTRVRMADTSYFYCINISAGLGLKSVKKKIVPW